MSRKPTAMRKYHKNKDGRILPCTASVKECPLVHYATKDDALDNRDRIIGSAKEGELINFEVQYVADELGNITPVSDGKTSLTKLGDKVTEAITRTNRRPSLPFGTIDVDLGEGRRLLVKREHYMKFGNTPTIRYYMTAWNKEDDYTIKQADMAIGSEDPVGYKAVQNFLQISLYDIKKKYDAELDEKVVKGYMRSDLRDLKKATFDRTLANAYDTVVNDIDQIEVMTVGADKAMQRYNIDLFDKSHSSELSLDLDSSQTAVRSQDIVSSLRMHAAKDTTAKDVVIRIWDRNDGENGKQIGRWSLSRGLGGQWFFSFEQQTGLSHVQPIDLSSPEHRNAINVIVDRYSSNAEEKKEFLKRVLDEVEPAIRSYEKTIAARPASTPEPTNITMVDPIQSEEQNKKTSLRSKLFGIF